MVSKHSPVYTFRKFVINYLNICHIDRRLKNKHRELKNPLHNRNAMLLHNKCFKFIFSRKFLYRALENIPVTYVINLHLDFVPVVM